MFARYLNRILRLRTLFFMFFFFLLIDVTAQVDTTSVITMLDLIYHRDQKTRKNSDSIEYISFIDSSNLIQIEKIINQYGWPGKDFVGAKGNTTAFLVVQHANLPVQEKYLPLLMKSVIDSQSRASDLALLQDRILMRQGKKQIYGSQIVPNGKTGKWNSIL